MEHLSALVSRYLSGDFFVSLPFWGVFALVVLVYRACPKAVSFKEWLLLLCSVGMLLTMPRFDPWMLAVLLAVFAMTYGCGKLLLDGAKLDSPKARRTVATAGIILNVAVLAFFKYAVVQKLIVTDLAVSGGDFMFLIGISYSSFRAMHFVIESYKKEIKEPSFLVYLNYMFFFPAFISGPIHRFNHYCANSAVVRIASFRSDFAAGMERIIHGLFKKTVLAAAIFSFTLMGSGTPFSDLGFGQRVLGLYASALYLFLDFSGYTDLAVGCARIMGFVLPENFNRPFLKENIQRLWANYHISLTSWLTDYIYWPLARKLRDIDYLRERPVLLSNVAIFVTFMACGIWHGNTLNFLFWGMYHGAGLATLNLYQKWKRKVRSPRLRKYFKSRMSYACGVLGAFNFYAMGMLLFVVDANELTFLLGLSK